MRSQKPNDTSGKTARHRDPLGDYPGRFQKHLESQHYSSDSIIQYGRCIDVLRRQMRAFDVELKELDGDRAAELIGKSEYRSHGSKTNVFIVRSFVKFLTALGAAKPTLAVVLDDSVRGCLKRDYEEYLRCQRGLSKRTIFHSWRFADRFLEFCFHGQEGDLASITPVDIARFMQHLTSRDKPLRDKTPPTHLRNFFLYLFRSGKTQRNLAPSVPRIAQRQRSSLPRHLTPEQVERLLVAVKADTPTGRRNYAMILLLARLGLRASEIKAIQVDDVDWRAGEIFIRGKGQQHDRLPLPHDVGEALAEYIRRDRVAGSRTMFVTERAPHRPFTTGQILNAILKEAFAKAKLEPPTKYVGSHILRHTLATSLARRGASLAEIGDMLRHRSQETTMIYAKLDIDGLRSIALPWPTTGGAQ